MLTSFEKQQIKQTIKSSMWFSNRDGMVFIDELSDNHLTNIRNQLKKKDRRHPGIEAEFNRRFNAETFEKFDKALELEMSINFYGY